MTEWYIPIAVDNRYTSGASEHAVPQPSCALCQPHIPQLHIPVWHNLIYTYSFELILVAPCSPDLQLNRQRPRTFCPRQPSSVNKFRTLPMHQGIIQSSRTCEHAVPQLSCALCQPHILQLQTPVCHCLKQAVGVMLALSVTDFQVITAWSGIGRVGSWLSSRRHGIYMMHGVFGKGFKARKCGPSDYDSFETIANDGAGI